MCVCTEVLWISFDPPTATLKTAPADWQCQCGWPTCSKHLALSLYTVRCKALESACATRSRQQSAPLHSSLEYSITRKDKSGETVADVLTSVSIRPCRSRRCRSAEAYSDQTFPWTICRFIGPLVCTCVRTCVGLSSALWKNGGSDPDAVWRHRSDGSRDEAGSGVWESVRGKGYFWGRIWGAPL